MKLEDARHAAFAVALVALHLSLGLVFYLVLTPVGALLRLLRIDVLGLRRDARVASYWRGRPS